MAEGILEEKPIGRLLRFLDAGKFAVGERLPSIKYLSAQLDVGPNVMRDVLLMAQMMGLVRIEPRAGTFVQSVDFDPPSDVLSTLLQSSLAMPSERMVDVMDARRVIEIESSGLAARHRKTGDLLSLRNTLETMQSTGDNYTEFVEPNETFHLCIARIAGNEALVKILRCLLEQLRPTLLATLNTRRHVAQDQKEHWQIYEAIADMDAEAARSAMSFHIKETSQYMFAEE